MWNLLSLRLYQSELETNNIVFSLWIKIKLTWLISDDKVCNVELCTDAVLYI